MGRAHSLRGVVIWLCSIGIYCDGSCGKPEDGREGKEGAGWRGGVDRTSRAEIEEQRVGKRVPALASPGLTLVSSFPEWLFSEAEHQLGGLEPPGPVRRGSRECCA